MNRINKSPSCNKNENPIETNNSNNSCESKENLQVSNNFNLKDLEQRIDELENQLKISKLYITNFILT